MRNASATFIVIASAALLAVTSGLGAVDRQAGTGAILGRVVDAESGQAIPGALVELTLSLPQTAIAGDDANAALTMLADGAGRFAFRDLPAGRYNFYVTATGFTIGGYNKRRPDGAPQALMLAAGQRVGDVAIKLWKQASINGTVVDEAGEPVVGVFVRVMRRTMVGGQPGLEVSGAGKSTDDRGVYRASGLDPGDYVVLVPITLTTTPILPAGATPTPAPRGIGPGGGQQVGNLLLATGGLRGVGPGAVGPAPNAQGRFAGYQTTFFPSATTSSRATTISLTAGEEKMGVDIQLTLVPTFRVSGTIAAPDGSAAGGFGVHLVSLEADQTPDSAPDDVAMSTSDPAGAFTILGVPPGQYQLLTFNRPAAGARGGPLGRGAPPLPPAPMIWAGTTIAVGNADVPGVALTMRPGLQVSGRIVFDGSATPPTPAQMQQRPIRLMSTRGPGRGGSGVLPGPAATAADGSFAIAGCLPGRYVVVAPGWPALKWRLKSIAAEGRDASDVPLDLASADLSSVTITFTDRPAEMSGTVRTPRGEIDPDALVVMFPGDSRAWGWPNSIHTATARVTPTGTFAFASLAPGDYLIAAIPDELSGNWQDPKVLQRLAAVAERVRLADGDHLTVDLKTRTIQ